jgi:hypothetical protein
VQQVTCVFRCRMHGHWVDNRKCKDISCPSLWPLGVCESVTSLTRLPTSIHAHAGLAPMMVRVP